MAVVDAPEVKGVSGSGGVDRLTAAQIVLNNAIPVVGVWFLGWQPLTPMFFYWLDGLLAIWGLGTVALVVTTREDRTLRKVKGWKIVPTWAAIVGLASFILAMPSIVAAAAVFGTLHEDLGDILRLVFSSLGAWVSLAIAVVSHVGQTVGELRWRPDVTLKATGVARGNFFIHRTLAMAMLVFWGAWGAAGHWALAVYVLLVACLFTFAQLNPQGYLRLIGYKEKQPAARRGRRSLPRATSRGER